MENHPFLKLQKILLEEDNKYATEQLILASLFIMVFESFKGFMNDNIECFFSDGFTTKDGKITFKRGNALKKIIKEKGRGNTGEHNNEFFRGCITWFHENGAITKNEAQETERLYKLRNDIGHELFSIIFLDNKPDMKLEDIGLILNVFSKISNWWLTEIEAAIDPDKFEGADFENAELTQLWLFKELIAKVLEQKTTIDEIIKKASKAAN